MGDFALLAWLCAVFNPVVGSSSASLGDTLPSPQLSTKMPSIFMACPQPRFAEWTVVAGL